MISKKEQDLCKEFSEFASSPSAKSSQLVDDKILKQHLSLVQKDKLTVFAKLAVIHSLTSVLSLAVCHQFDMNPFNSQISLADYFMKFGHSACMVFCGFLFVGGSLFAARQILNNYELAILRKTFALQIFALCSISLGVFMACGAQTTLIWALLWIVGAYVGSALSTFSFPKRSRPLTA